MSMSNDDYRPGASDVTWPETAHNLLKHGRFRESQAGFELAIERAADTCEGHLSNAELRGIAHDVVDEVFGDGEEEDRDVAQRRERNEQLTTYYGGP